MLDLVGYSTAPEDVAIAKSRLDQLLGLILATPWWAIWGFALITTAWLIWVSWPRQISSTRPVDPTESPSPNENLHDHPIKGYENNHLKFAPNVTVKTPPPLPDKLAEKISRLIYLRRRLKKLEIVRAQYNSAVGGMEKAMNESSDGAFRRERTGGQWNIALMEIQKSAAEWCPNEQIAIGPNINPENPFQAAAGENPGLTQSEAFEFRKFRAQKEAALFALDRIFESANNEIGRVETAIGDAGEDLDIF